MDYKQYKDFVIFLSMGMGHVGSKGWIDGVCSVFGMDALKAVEFADAYYYKKDWETPLKAYFEAFGEPYDAALARQKEVKKLVDVEKEENRSDFNV